ncbi:Hypothetical protein I5071_90880 [Sandaracinus amylolyticus]|nr:Hypothetical protein I5071_90880 [Sandaracinus amylolyticus]
MSTSPRLSSLDLNLLVALDALLRERSVTTAGRRIGLSQPAMSHALSRLRELLGDPILAREGRVMRHTALAERLAPQVRRLLGEIESTLLGHRAFVPARAQRTFRVATNDHCGAVLIPELLARIRDEAPLVELEMHAHRGEAPAHELERGELDVAVGVFLRVAPGLVCEELFQESFACIVRKGHPRVGKALTLERFLELDHVLVSAPDYGPGVVDFALAKQSLRRRVAVRVPSFLVAPALIARTDMICTVPRRIAELAARAHALRVVAPPIEIPPFAVQMARRAGADSDVALRWLRAHFVAAAQRVS